MTARTSPNWTGRLLIGLLLLLIGAAGATWTLARWDAAARLVGVAPSQPDAIFTARPVPHQQLAPTGAAGSGDLAARERIEQLEQRLARVEAATRVTAGSVGRADALLVAFAARRAIERGVALGYLENLLVERFGGNHPRAVATIIAASRQPVRLDQLATEYEALEPVLKAGAPGEDWTTGLRRELASLVAVRRSDRPSPRPAARYERAQARLNLGHVDSALAETMRLPGAARAGPWISRARRYIVAHRALDEIESAALIGG